MKERKIQIIGCKDPLYWYCDLVGQKFIVTDNTPTAYEILHEGKPGWVDIDDCIDVEENLSELIDKMPPCGFMPEGHSY